MALKRTSEVLTVSTRFDNGTANAFAVNQIDLQLNPLDQEVFVVTGVKFDMMSGPPHSLIYPVQGWVTSEDEVALTTTRPTTMPDLGDSNVIAYANRHVSVYADASGVATATLISETNPSDAPDANLDYLGIVATSDMFLSIDANDTSLPSDVAIRVYGYRAKADAATYAALVQSEVLSS